MDKYLEIDLASNVDTYLWYSLKFCILQSRDEYTSWINNHFINIVSYNHLEDNWLKLDYSGYHTPYSLFKEVLGFEYFQSQYLLDVKVDELIKERLDKNKYIQAEIDEFYIVCKNRYKKEHFSHPVLIYGYNDFESVFYCVGFSQKAVFTKFKISFEEINQGVSSACQISDQLYIEKREWHTPLVVIYLKHWENKFSISNFMKNLTLFVNSDIDKNHSSIVSEKVSNKEFFHTEFGYGVKAIHNLSSCLEGKNFFDLHASYLDIHFVTEHCRELYKKIDWVFREDCRQKDKNFELMFRYKMIVDNFERLRLLALKEHIVDNKVFSTYSSRTLKIGSILEKNLVDEENILNEVLESLVNSKK